jgi:hypothetical protein
VCALTQPIWSRNITAIYTNLNNLKENSIILSSFAANSYLSHISLGR